MHRRRSLVAWSIVIAAWCLAPAPGAGITREKLDEIIQKLEANGQAWLKGENIDPNARVDLAKVRFDRESAAHLQAALRSSRRDTARLYALNRLLEHLQAADPETVRAALPAVKMLHTRTRTGYRTFPKLTKRQVDSLRMPPFNPRLTTDFIMGRMAALDKERENKVARELFIVRHNEVIFGIEKNTFLLMLQAADAREDSALVKTMFLEERKGNAIFLTIANAFADPRRKIDPERARRIYPLFRAHLSRLAMQNKRKYVDHGQANLQRSGTSAFTQKDEYAGIRILNAYNRLVEATKLPDLKKVRVPSGKEIAEYHKKLAAGAKKRK
jgi:hypothetical protein